MSNMGLFYCEDECILPGPLPEPKLVPLKDVLINAVLEGPLATIDFEMTYINPGENPIKATYEFPLNEETILSSLTVQIGD